MENMQKAKPVASAASIPISGGRGNTTTNTNATPPPPNFRRKRRHSEPHLSATKPYKNFVTHWKLDTKKPPNTAPSPPPLSHPSSSASPSSSSAASTSSSSSSSSSSQEHKQTSSNWSPSNSEALKSIFHPYKKDSPSPTPPAPQRLSQRRGSLPHIMEGGIYHRPSSASSSSSYGTQDEDTDDRLQTIPEFNSSSAFSSFHPTSFQFPPLLPHHQYSSPSSSSSADSPPHHYPHHHERRDLAPMLNVKGDAKEKSLPSLHTLLQHVQDVSLSDNDDAPMMEERDRSPVRDEIEPPRSYVVRRRMSIDSLLE